MISNRLRGISCMLFCVACFAVMDAILKIFAGYYAPMQVGAMRGASSLPFVVVSITVTGKWREVWPVRWGLHLARGLLALVMLSGFVYALRVLSLAAAYAIFFVAPLLVTALSVPILGEHVGWRRWLAILAGLGGVLTMLRPAGDGLATLSTLGALGAAAAAVAYAFSAISVRVLTRTDSTVSMVFWFLIMLTVFAGGVAAPGWVAVRTEHWQWLIGLGLSGALGQHFITEAFRHAPASVIAPFEYTALLWAVAIDWTFWDVLPSSRTILGGAIIIGSGLYLIWRERQLRLETASNTEIAGNLP